MPFGFSFSFLIIVTNIAINSLQSLRCQMDKNYDGILKTEEGYDGRLKREEGRGCYRLVKKEDVRGKREDVAAAYPILRISFISLFPLYPLLYLMFYILLPRF